MSKGIRLTLAAAAALLATQAMAFEFNGYLRAGPVLSGAESSGATQTYGKYSLGGAGQMYRLGNEGDFYGEFLLSHTQKVGNQTVKLGWMPAIFSAKPNPTSENNYETKQAFIEVAGVDFAPNVKFWGGKRYQRADVHIVDTFYINYGNDIGAGAYDIDVGGAKLGIHAYSSDEFTTKDGTKATAARVTADLYDIQTGSDGKLRAVVSLVNGDYINGSSGFSLSLKHDQSNFGMKGLTNTLWLQAANGHAALTGGFSDTKSKGVRAVDSVNWQSGPWGGQAQAMWERSKSYADLTNVETEVTRTSLGGRVSYAVTQNFKLLTEVGITSAKQDGVAGTGRLNKITFAPTLALNGDFWSRPELRFYATHISWNDAAYNISGSTPAGLTDKSKKSATLVGVQAELWF
ncbi:carbohydrate porin [uncultured Aquabacterium sp.]|uniref:maltoporin n=1 Tax=Aquabacterium sp. TaxID=1872578 RepID=UPI0025F9C5C2|nr:carbohydrate porin [uncultured Aquabacterium sp.]